MIRTVITRSIVAISAILLVACSEADRAKVFDTAQSPHGDYTLTATVIEPWYPQGPYYVALDLIRAKNAVSERLLKTTLAYDGVPFTKKNIGIRWTGDHAALACLRATDRPDKGIQITVHEDATVSTQLRVGC